MFAPWDGCFPPGKSRLDHNTARTIVKSRVKRCAHLDSQMLQVLATLLLQMLLLN
jgi:hypothetical protein